MKRFTLWAAGCAAAFLAAGCATPSGGGQSNVATAPPTCAQIAASRAAAQEDRLEALEEQAQAWKVVVPFVAAAKLAQSAADLAAAEKRLAALDAKASRLGCMQAAG
jgi:hypothetical protein